MARGYSTTEIFHSTETGGSHLGAVGGRWGPGRAVAGEQWIGHHLFLSGFIPLSPLVISLLIFITVTIIITIYGVLLHFSD